MSSDRLGFMPQLRDELAQLEKAFAGDLVFVVSPATVNRVATSAAFTRTVKIELKSADGVLHDWFNKAITTGVSVGDTSTAGTATIASTTLTFTKGVASVVVTGSAHAWLENETNTLTIAQATILGYTVTSKTSVETIIAA
jgi:hypothetical protein